MLLTANSISVGMTLTSDDGFPPYSSVSISKVCFAAKQKSYLLCKVVLSRGVHYLNQDLITYPLLKSVLTTTLLRARFSSLKSKLINQKYLLFWILCTVTDLPIKRTIKWIFLFHEIQVKEQSTCTTFCRHSRHCFPGWLDIQEEQKNNNVPFHVFKRRTL